MKGIQEETQQYAYLASTGDEWSSSPSTVLLGSSSMETSYLVAAITIDFIIPITGHSVAADSTNTTNSNTSGNILQQVLVRK